jgi:hypothetical protein
MPDGSRKVSEKPPPTYVLRLVPLPKTDPIRELRWVLKRLLRQHGFRCLSVSEERGSELDSKNRS